MDYFGINFKVFDIQLSFVTLCQRPHKGARSPGCAPKGTCTLQKYPEPHPKVHCHPLRGPTHVWSIAVI